MKPVDPIKELVGESKERCSGKPPLDGAVENQKKVTLLERPCQCVCGDEARNLLAESPDNYVDVLKEPLSAPF